MNTISEFKSFESGESTLLAYLEKRSRPADIVWLDEPYLYRRKEGNFVIPPKSNEAARNSAKRKYEDAAEKGLAVELKCVYSDSKRSYCYVGVDEGSLKYDTGLTGNSLFISLFSTGKPLRLAPLWHRVLGITGEIIEDKKFR